MWIHKTSIDWKTGLPNGRLQIHEGTSHWQLHMLFLQGDGVQWNWQSSYDIRQKDEYQCGQFSFARPSLGSDILPNSWNPFRDAHQGLPVFDITMKPSIDCSKKVPVGYFSTFTKKSHMNLQQDISSSSLKMAKRNGEAVKMGISASLEKVDFGIESSTEDTFFKSSQSQVGRKYIATSIEAVEDTYTIRVNRPPPFDFVFKLKLELQLTTQPMSDIEFVRDQLLPYYPGFLDKVVVGESYAQVSREFTNETFRMIKKKTRWKTWTRISSDLLVQSRNKRRVHEFCQLFLVGKFTSLNFKCKFCVWFFQQVTTVENTFLEETDSESRSKELKVMAKYSFVEVSGGRETSTGEESQFSSFLESSYTTEAIVGSIPDPETFEMERSFQPGVLQTSWKPICELIQVNDPLAGTPERSRELKQECERQVSMLSFAVKLSHLSNKFATPSQVSDSFRRMKEYGQLSRSAVPFFGIKFHSQSSTRRNSGNSVGDCLLLCSENSNCQAFLFVNRSICELCVGNCLKTSLCRDSMNCIGGYMQVTNIPARPRPRYLPLHQYSRVNGDVVHSERIVEALPVSRWCRTFAPSLYRMNHTEVPNTNNAHSVQETLASILRHLKGQNAGFKCFKICSRVLSGDFVVEMMYPRENVSYTFEKIHELTNTNLYSSNWVESCEKTFFGVSFDLIKKTFALEYKCKCFGVGNVRGIQADWPRFCETIHGVNVCEDYRFKVFSSHFLTSFNHM